MTDENREGNRRRIGTKYEEIAADYLRGKGYRILTRNFRSRYGEIDIVARKGPLLVIAEVKYRGSDSCGGSLGAVDRGKQRRICKTVLYYYMRHGYGTDVPCRFDVIGIQGDGRIVHVENAFEFQW